LLKGQETRLVGGKVVHASVPITAHFTLGEGEFNSYYMRAVCRRAVWEGQDEVEIYRGKQVTRPRPAAEHAVRSRKNPRELLDHMRATNISVEGAFPGPNSGKSIRLIKGKD